MTYVTNLSYKVKTTVLKICYVLQASGDYRTKLIDYDYFTLQYNNYDYDYINN